MSETNQNDAARWLSKAEVAPPFAASSDLKDWEIKRNEIRSRIWSLLGKLPPRPAKVEAHTISRQDRDGYVLEKFEFDNGAGATVPGYLLLPKNTVSKAPAILYCHWHGGQYEIGKEELFQSAHTPEAPGPTFAELGYVVLGIDAYCFGERSAMVVDLAAKLKKAERGRCPQANSTCGSDAHYGA
jgi:hypothetical protein